MWPLLLLWGCLVLPVSGHAALQGPKEVRGFEGGTVTVQCTYSEELKDRRKYWCRKAGLVIYRCSSTIYAGKGQETTQGRVSIRDSPQELVLTVTLRDLTLQDTGKYWCGVDKLGRDEAVLIALLVSSGTSPHAGTSQAESSYPTTQLNSVLAKGSHPVPNSSSSKPRVSIPMVRMLAPVLVLFTLLLAIGLMALGSCALRWRKEAQLAAKTQRNEKVYLSHTPLGNGRDPEYTMIHPAGPPGPLASSKPSASLCTEIQDLSQTTEEEEATSQAPEGDLIPMTPLHMCDEEPGFSKFISV